ncbi:MULTISPECIES: RNA polymerase sigma factor [unclassified Streptosporangium]|uniref:RNA polymerase sigma factor n=1 Tax=unclassified Streptosporangium TaxID=2632669 RepID=UPI002E27DC12|nr:MULTISPECIES: RNA polymerase sigma factor [unclassified Streptosporangium]
MRVNSDRPPDRTLPDLVFPPSFFADDVAGDAVSVESAVESAVASDAGVIRLSLRDPERFAEIFHRYFAAIHRYASARLGADAADDVAAETFLAAFRQRERYDLSRHDARAWLFGIATNLIRRHRRDEVRLYRALERARDASVTGSGGVSVVGAGASAADSADAGLGVDAQRRLAGALAVLKAGDREVLLLVAYGELSYAEVSDALGIPSGTVGSRLNRARKRVREVLNANVATKNTDTASKGDRHDG